MRRSLLWAALCAVRHVFGAGWRKQVREFERAWEVGGERRVRCGNAWGYVVSYDVSVKESDRCWISEDGKGVKCAALRQWWVRCGKGRVVSGEDWWYVVVAEGVRESDAEVMCRSVGCESLCGWGDACVVGVL
jgi:hypothetical protein